MHPEKAESPIEITEFENDISINEQQSKNAYALIETTEGGITIFNKEAHLQKYFFQ